MKKIIEVEAKIGVFSEIAEIVKPLYEKNPLDFLFIGPTGFYVKQVADTLALKLSKTINRDAFMVVNQWATETLKKFKPTALTFDRNFFEVFISREVELISKEVRRRGDDERYANFLKAISRSNSSLSYVLEIFEKTWELLYEEKYSHGMYSVVDEMMNGDSGTKRLISELIDRSKKIFEDRENVYDPLSVYKWYVEELPKIQKNKLGKTLVLSGFFDLTPTIEKMLSVMFTQFEDIYAILWKKVNDPAFNQLDNVFDFFSENGFSTSNNRRREKLSPYPENVEVLKFKDRFQENAIVTKMVKKLLISGERPDDIALIAPNRQVMETLAENLKDLEVPYRFKDDVPLGESKVVRILLQPLKTIVSRDVEDVLAMIEAGYGGQTSLTMDEVEELFNSLDFMNDYEDPRTRRERWLSRIDQKMNILQGMLGEEDIHERVESQLEALSNLKKVLLNVFETIQEVEKKKRSKNVGWYRKLIKKYIHEKQVVNEETLQKYSSESSVAKELNALVKFEEVLLKVEESIANAYEKVSFSMFYKILTNIVNVERFHASERYSNTVEIMDVNNARFVEKKYKFYVSFTDSHYPSLKINPLLIQATEDVNFLMKSEEYIEKEDLLFSMLMASQVYISYPISDVEGKPILPSFYVEEISNGKEVQDFTSTKRDLIPSSPEEVYSQSEKRIYEIVNSPIEVNDVKFSWKTSKTDVGTISHNKLMNYVDCPLKYYLKFVADVKGKFDYKHFNEGLIKHRVMKEVYDLGEPFTISLNEIKKIVEKHWNDIYLSGLYTYRMPKEVEVDRISEELEAFLQYRKDNGCFKLGKDVFFSERTLKTEETVRTQALLNEKKYVVEARIDRFDKLDQNIFLDFSLQKNKVKVEKTSSDKNAYMIVDYKNSLSSSKAEQLLFYDFVLRNSKEWKRKIGESDMYMVFFELKPSTKKGSDEKQYMVKFIKRQGNEYISKTNKWEKYNVVDFEKWLCGVLKAIEDSNFLPIAVDRKTDGFIKKNNQKCMGYKYSCEYVEICSLLKRVKNFELVK
jgi:ATP-dependent helicase/nuclease subunit B